jgi:hypothetical protein
MPVEPPQNGEYLVAAYIITAVILVGYWLALWRRGREKTGKKSLSGEEKTRAGRKT